MYSDIVKEYTDLLNAKINTEKSLSALPRGYIYRQKYSYLKYRKGSTVESRYLKPEEVSKIESQLKIRKELEAELPLIENRLTKLEKAAELLSDTLSRKLEMLKLSVGMDSISDEEKEKCISFSISMTSIEGILVSREVETSLDTWHKGKATFATIFEQTLIKYGFIKEV